MSLLSAEELMALVVRGVITNVPLDHINSSSIDITLGPKILRETVKHVHHYTREGEQIATRQLEHISYSMREPLKMREEDCENGINIYPGEFFLAHSEQEFYLPNDISASYVMKSSMARTGLNAATAGHADAGWKGSVLTLELMNVTRNHVIQLKRGDKIGQMLFFHHRMVPDDLSYAVRGRYNNDKTVQGAKS
jgi:dCTP deaminase